MTADDVALAGGVDRSAALLLGGGDNVSTIAAEVMGTLRVSGSDGDDVVVITASAVIIDNFFARVGDGANSVTHAGTVEGAFRVVTANEDDQVTIDESAIVVGETELGLGEQADSFVHCGGRLGASHAGPRFGFFFRRR